MLAQQHFNTFSARFAGYPLTVRALSRFEFCPEVTAKVRRRGVPIHEVPIHYTARTFDAGKKIRAWDAVEAFWTLLRYRFWK